MSLHSEMVGVGLQSHRASAILGSVVTGLTAAGTNQGNALALAAVAVQVVGTAAASTGVRLPLGCSKNDEIRIRNGGANAIAVYNPTGGSATSLGSLAATGGTATAKCTTDNGLTWVLC